MHSLICRLKEPNSGERDFVAREGMVLGRHRLSDCVLADPLASGQHARFVLVDGSLAIEDMGSTNHTHLDNGRSLGEGDYAVLNQGARFQIGSTMVEVISQPLDTQSTLSDSQITLMHQENQTLVADSSPITETWDANAQGTGMASPFQATAPQSASPSSTGDVAAADPAEPRGVQASSKSSASKSAAKSDSAIDMDATIDASYLTHHARLAMIDGTQRRVVLIAMESMEIDGAAVVGLTMGRSSNCHLRLADASISSEHACLYYKDGFFYLQDRGSTNGTFSMEQQLASGESARLNPDSMIQLGSVTMCLLVDTDASGHKMSEDRYEQALEALVRSGVIVQQEATRALSEFVEGSRHPYEYLFEASSLLPEIWSKAVQKLAFGNAAGASKNKSSGGALSKISPLYYVVVLLAIVLAAVYFLL